MIRSGIERMPYNAMLGVRITAMEGGRATGILPSRPEVGNHAGTMHAGAQFSLVEATSGAAVGSAFLDLLRKATPLAQGAELTYKRPGKGDPTPEAALSPQAIERPPAELDAHRRAR